MKTRKRLTPEERLTRMAERWLKLRQKGGSYYDRSRDLLQRMISAGLQVGQPIIIGGKAVKLKNNWVRGKPAGKYCMIEEFELVECSKKEIAALQKEAAAVGNSATGANALAKAA